MKNAALALLLAVPAVTQASGLGRLFFTPEQRAQLEYNYARSADDGNETSSTLKLNGIVQQHGGARTVWINGSAQNSAHGGDPAAEEVAVPGKSKSIRIRVGEKLFTNTNKPQDPPVPAE